jgi:hypothetical protein
MWQGLVGFKWFIGLEMGCLREFWLPLVVVVNQTGKETTGVVGSQRRPNRGRQRVVSPVDDRPAAILPLLPSVEGFAPPSFSLELAVGVAYRHHVVYAASFHFGRCRVARYIGHDLHQPQCCQILSEGYCGYAQRVKTCPPVLPCVLLTPR